MFLSFFSVAVSMNIFRFIHLGAVTLISREMKNILDRINPSSLKLRRGKPGLT
jgi:hypothetical protein